MKITPEWLKENRTKNGGYTKAQILLLGIKWPPKHGWLKAIIGDEISDDAAREFERIAKQDDVELNPNLFDIDPPTK